MRGATDEVHLGGGCDVQAFLSAVVGNCRWGSWESGAVGAVGAVGVLWALGPLGHWKPAVTQ
jgi:hypothetical protein